MELFEETLTSQTLFKGKIVTLKTDTVRLPNGAEGYREVVEHPGGVCVLPLADDGTVYTVRQFRYPFAQVIEELPAGKLDGGEPHREAGLRELSEELGATAEEFIYLGHILPSLGFSNEVTHLYLARGLSFGAQHLDPDEFLEIRKTTLDDLTERVMAGELTDAKTVSCVLKAREYLRREAGGTL